MRYLSKKEWVAAATGIILMLFIFFGAELLNLFNKNTIEIGNMNENISGVEMTDVVVGGGDAAVRGDTLTVHYTGMLEDGTVFDSSHTRGEPFIFPLGVGQVIRGWDEGMVGMRVGGKRRLVISPEYGYGAIPIGPIPPNSTLIFEVELLEVARPQ